MNRITWHAGWTLDNGVTSNYDATVKDDGVTRQCKVYRTPGGGWQGAIPSLGWYSPWRRNSTAAKRWVRRALVTGEH